MLKLLRMLAVLVLTVGFILAPSANGEQLPAPLEKDILPGVTYISYAGQDLRIDTPVAMHLSLVPVGDNLIQLKFKCRTSSSGDIQTSSEGELAIHWENWKTDIYSGPPPEEEWEGILHTESGFTEK